MLPVVIALVCLGFAHRDLKPDDIDQLIFISASRNGLDPFLLKGLLSAETGLNPRAASRHGVGIASFTPAGVAGVNFLRERAARRSRRPLEPRFTLALAREPRHAVPAAADLLGYFVGLFGRDGGISAYNGGYGHGRAVRRLGFREARRRGHLDWSGKVRMGGGRYLLRVIDHANRFRAEAGLPPLSPP